MLNTQNDKQYRLCGTMTRGVPGRLPCVPRLVHCLLLSAVDVHYLCIIACKLGKLSVLYHCTRLLSVRQLVSLWYIEAA